MLYFIVFAISLLFAALAQHYKSESCSTNRSLLFFSLSAASLLAIHLLREGVGTDYYDVYVDQYNTFLATGQSRFEIGFTFLMYLSSLISTDYHLLLGICSIVIVGGTYLAVYRSRSNYLVAIALFLSSGFFFFSMNGVRQSMAIAILMNAVVSYESKRRKQFIVMVLAAASIHLYSLVALFLLLSPILKKIKGVHIFLIFIASCLLSGPLTDFAVSVGSMFSDQIKIYATVPHLRKAYLAGNFDVLDFLLCFLPLLAICIVQKIKAPSRFFTLENSYQIMLFGGLLATGLSCSVAIFARVAVYFSPFSILCMGIYVNDESWKEKPYSKVMVVFFIAMTSILFFYYFVRNFSAVLPYTSFLFQ